jgi:hypothetical protein
MTLLRARSEITGVRPAIAPGTPERICRIDNTSERNTLRTRTLIATGVLVATVGIVGGGTAFAQTPVSGSAGPIPLPNVPVQICVNNTCQSTPPLSSVSLNATATPNATGGLPTITPGLCTSGIGPTLTVKTGSTPATLAGTVSGTLPNGTAFSRTLDSLTIPANGTGTVSACTSVTPPVPVPPVPPLPGAGGLLDVILNLLKSLLGGLVPGLPGVPGVPGVPVPGL